MAVMISWPLLFSQLFNGLALGALLALTSAGLTIIYGALGVVNFAHGAFFMVGAYAGYLAFAYTDSFVLAMAVGALFAAGVGILLERSLIRFYYARPPEDQILLTFGLAIVLVELVRAVFGSLSRRVAVPAWGAGVVNLGFMIYPRYRLEALSIVALTLSVLGLLLYRTRQGFIVRAGIEDSLMVSMLGINVARIFLLVFALGAMAAGFAGIVDAPIVTVNPDMGQDLLVRAFVVIVIGGVGSFGGAVLGGLIAGEILSLTAMINPAYSDVMLYAAMAAVLILRPQGLMGAEGRR
jgi:branched-chain amino acid transport system permease protein